MPKDTSTTASADVSAAVINPDFPVTLDEFCSRLSQSDKRVELISGFYHVEKVADRLRDTESVFQGRFNDFANQPV